jgi:hypothetical protein
MLRSFDCVYEGKRYPVMASTHVAARSLGTRHIANLLGCVEPSKVAVVDLEIAAGYQPCRYLNVTETLVGTVDIQLDRRIEQRRSRVDTLDRREQQDKVWAKQAKLCVCGAGARDPMDCTCKSYDRAVWAVRNDDFDMKLANAHLDGITIDAR